MKFADREVADWPLARMFQNTTAALLDFLILNQGVQYSLSELVRVTGLPRRTLERSIALLKQEKLIIRTSKRRTLQHLYEINTESERVRALIKYAKTTVRENLENASKV